MKIGVDAGCLGIRDERLKLGVYQFTCQLLRELGKSDRRNEYRLYSFYPIETEMMAQLGPKMTNVVVKPTIGWNYLALPLKLALDRPDFFIGPGQSLPAFLPCLSLVIVHDLMFERFPEFYPESLGQLRRITRWAVKKATKIIAVSRATKKDLIDFYQVPEPKITVEYRDCSPIYRPQPPAKTKKSYFLFVGAFKKTKNIPRILEAYAQFLKKSKNKVDFVFCGSDRWLDKEIELTIEKFALKDKVKFRGFIPEKKMPAFYNQVLAFVSPSLYEGFGLTNLEAMACGCPVVAGNTGASPEIVGSAGLLVDPENVSAISSAMTRLASSPALRQKLSRAGLSRARQFSWERFAEEIVKIITSEKCR